MESKFKVGDRVRVLDCPVMLDVVGKSGVIRHRQGDLYRVEVDGKVIPDYALEADIELIPANPFLESNELISKLLKENKIGRNIMATMASDERQLRNLIKEATGMKVYKSTFNPLVFNVYYSIVQEYKDESSPHITIIQGSWHATNGGEYKISIYTPTMLFGTKRKINIQYVRDIAVKITNALDRRFGNDTWNTCNEESRVWLPLSRTSFYLQIPNFN